MNCLRIVHRQTSSNTQKTLAPCSRRDAFFASDYFHSNSSSFAVWKTCLREVVFLPSDVTDQKADEFGALSEEQSLCFLAEILCGIHSPLLGENEVFGQFKQFADEQKKIKHPLFLDHQKWLPFLYQEVKRVRSEHVRHWGSNSYGSLLRKLLEKQNDISVFGTGQLTEEILPWLSHKKSLQVCGRNQERLNFFSSKYAHLTIQNSTQKKELKDKDHFLFHSTLIISASISHDQVTQLVEGHGDQVKMIYDLRGLHSKNEEVDFRNKVSARFPEIQVIFLQDLFDSIQSQREKTKHLIQLVQNEIQARVQDHLLRLEHRPLGWDDLCA